MKTKPLPHRYALTSAKQHTRCIVATLAAQVIMDALKDNILPTKKGKNFCARVYRWLEACIAGIQKKTVSAGAVRNINSIIPTLSVDLPGPQKDHDQIIKAWAAVVVATSYLISGCVHSCPDWTQVRDEKSNRKPWVQLLAAWELLEKEFLELDPDADDAGFKLYLRWEVEP